MGRADEVTSRDEHLLGAGKDFREADAIRGRLRDQGIVLEDTATGTVWRAV